MDDERDVLAARLWMSLNAVMHGDHQAADMWLNSHNTALGDTPHNKMQTKQGMSDLLTYLEARRYRL